MPHLAFAPDEIAEQDAAAFELWLADNDVLDRPDFLSTGDDFEIHEVFSEKSSP